MVKLDAGQAFGQDGWLRAENGDPVSAADFAAMRRFTVPNTFFVSYGNLDSSALQNVEYNARRVVRTFKREHGQYHYIDEKITSDIDIRHGLTSNEDLYGWIHAGHGAGGDLILDRYTWQAPWIGWAPVPVISSRLPYKPSHFSVHHKLAKIILVSCQAGMKEGEWRRLVAPGGVLHADRLVLMGMNVLHWTDLDEWPQP
jgi:hypothetical protein